jgi:integrase
MLQARGRVATSQGSLEVLQIDGRLRYLDSLVDGSRYARQKGSLEKEFMLFLEKFSGNEFGQSTPEDIRRFLVYKDRKGKTRVHMLECAGMGEEKGECGCPKKLSVGSVQTILGKLSGLFSEQGRVGAWQPLTGLGNPVNSLSLKKYVQAVRLEQSAAHVGVKQAPPLFLGKLRGIVQFIDSGLKDTLLKPAERFVYCRDRAFFLLQFFAGDRASDLGKVLAQEVRRLPGDGGLVFNHTVGKTLSNGRVNTFAIQRTVDAGVCPVRALESYVSEAGQMGVNLSLGYLFRPVGKSRAAVLEECLSYSVVYERLKFYLRAVGLDEGETPHSLRRGCAITLSLSGAADQAERVMGHVGWFTSKSLERYSEISKLVDVGSVSSLFAGVAKGGDSVGELYKCFGKLEGLPKAF